MGRVIRRLKEAITSPKNGIEIIVRNTFGRFIPDIAYIQLLALLRFGKKFNLDNPRTFNEKLNWLKLYNRKPQYSLMADKYAVKDFVKNIIGEQYIVPCYGKWNSFDDIDFDKLPSSFVLKCTHDSSGVIICKDKNDFDKRRAKIQINRCLKKNGYFHSREWVYKNVPHNIIADMLLDDNSGHELIDYKFMCFNGVPQYMYCTNKAEDIFENFYDMDFNSIEINHGFRRRVPEFNCPKEFELMKELAAKLSKGIPFVRVDFFDVNHHVYFGEFTFYDWAGLKPFADKKWDDLLGSQIILKE